MQRVDELLHTLQCNYSCNFWFLTNKIGPSVQLGMVLNETLRLYPPVATFVRETFKDLKLGEEMVIPKGVSVIADILSIHRNPKYWGSDANEFRPERFRDGVAAATGNHPSAFIPFASGPRVCLGQNFAVLEAKVAMSILLKHFKFTFTPSYRHAPVAFLTLSPQHGIPIIVETDLSWITARINRFVAE